MRICSELFYQKHTLFTSSFKGAAPQLITREGYYPKMKSCHQHEQGWGACGYVDVVQLQQEWGTSGMGNFKLIKTPGVNVCTITIFLKDNSLRCASIFPMETQHWVSAWALLEIWSPLGRDWGVCNLCYIICTVPITSK